LQVTTDPARASSSLMNFAVDDRERHITELARRSLTPEAIETSGC